MLTLDCQRGNMSGKSPRKKAVRAARQARHVKRKPSSRRIGTENSKTRVLILDVAEQVMREDGYAAVTSRKLAEQAGLKSQLVHYYFRTMDDLFVALWRRYSAKNVARHAQALDSSQPLRRLWETMREQDSSLIVEFIALARHRKALRVEVDTVTAHLRGLHVEGLARVIDKYGLRKTFRSAENLAVLLVSLSQSLVLESELGLSHGHAVYELVDSWLEQLEGPRQSASEDQLRVHALA
jgi:AcrR family transcriptional regulator